MIAVNEPAKLGRNNSLKKNAKRPVSNIFMKAESGSVKNKTEKRGGSVPPVNLLQNLGGGGSGSSLASPPIQAPALSTSPIGSSMTSALSSSLSLTATLSSSPSFSPLGTLASSSPPKTPTTAAAGDAPLRSPRLTADGQPLMQSTLTRRMSLIETHVIVQTKDRSEWLKRELTLKELGIEIFDSLLLVRQEKILSFYERLEEDAGGLYTRLTEQAEAILQQLQSISGEIESMKAGVVLVTAKRDVLKVLSEYRGDDGFMVRVGDEIEIFKRDGDRWFGRVVSSGAEGFFPAAIVQDPSRRTPAESAPAKLTTRMQSSTDSEQPMRMEGFLLKKGRTFDQWKKKYYRLRNHNMWYYKSEMDEKPVGHFSIIGAKITTAPNQKKKANTFIVVADGAERHLSAPSEEAMEQWVAALNQEKNAS